MILVSSRKISESVLLRRLASGADGNGGGSVKRGRKFLHQNELIHEDEKRMKKRTGKRLETKKQRRVRGNSVRFMVFVDQG